MTTTEEIRARRVELEQQLKEHDAARKKIIAKQHYIQEVCPHKHSRTFTEGSSPSKSTTEHFKCDDCGKHTTR